MKRTILILNILFPALGLAQQSAYYSLFQENWVLINPAILDHSYLENSNNVLIINSSVNQQWLGFDEGPRQMNLRAEFLPSSKTKKKGFAPQPKWGLGITQEQLGVFRGTGAYGNFAYTIRPDPRTSFSAGFNVGFLGQRIHLERDILEDWDKDLFAQSLALSNRSSLNVDAGLFIRKTIKKKQLLQDYYFGLSASPFANVSFGSTPGMERKMHLNLLIGSLMKPYKKYTNGYFEPSIWIRYLPGANYFISTRSKVPLSFDFAARMHLQNQIWFGAGYGTSANINLALGYRYISNTGKSNLKGGLMMNFPSRKYDLGYSMEVFLGMGLSTK